MPAAPTVRACIRDQTGSTPPDGAQLDHLGVDTGVLEGCLNSRLPLPPGVPYADGSIDPAWMVSTLIGDAAARQAAGGAQGAALMAVMPEGGGRPHFKIGKAAKRTGAGKAQAAAKPKGAKSAKKGGAKKKPKPDR